MTTHEKVKALEDKFEVTSITVRRFGRVFQVYPWLKGRLFHKMITGKETMQSRNVGLYIKQVSSIFYGLHNFFGRYSIWVFTNSTERRLIEGKYHDKLVDWIGNDGGYKTLVVEQRLFQYVPYRKVASKNVMSRSFFLVFEEIYGRLFLRNVKVENVALMHEILEEVSGGINHQQILRKYLAQYRLMKFWLRILPRPKVVFLSVSYTNFGYIRAFRELGIKVVEVQHGIISKNHHAYFYAKEMDPIQFPEYLVTVGEKEVAVFKEENSFPVNEVVPVGSWIIDHYRTQKRTEKRELPKILFTLQDGVMSAGLIQFILELSPKVSGKFEIQVQPRRTTKQEYLIDFPELDSIRFSEEDFYSEVINCDIHATVYSTTAIEALSLGIPNILVNIDNQSREQLDAFIGGNEYTFVVETVETFLEAIPKLLQAKRDEIEKSNEDNIKQGYKSNIKSLLSELIDD